MKRVLKLLGRLYPRAWRDRYGVEFEALLDDRRYGLRDLLDVLCGAIKMHRNSTLIRLTTIGGLIGVSAGITLSLAVSPRYVSKTPLSLTLANGSPAQPGKDTTSALLENLVKTHLSDVAIAPIILHYDLYPEERAQTGMPAALAKFRKSIDILPSTTTDGRATLTLFFSYRDAAVAQSINRELASLLVAVSPSPGAATGDFPRSYFLSVTGPASLPTHPRFPKHTFFAIWGLVGGMGLGLLAGTFKRVEESSAR